MSNIAIFERPQPIILDMDFKRRIIEFNEALAHPPGNEEVRAHPYIKVDKVVDGKKVKEPLLYLPIEYVEAKLNHFFNGLWQTVSFKYQVIVNEIVGDLELCVYHPDAGIWLRRAGTGAVVIQQRVEYEDDGVGGRRKKEQDLLDINRKIANTLTKDMGHLKSECIKNAAKSFGRTFGSDLARSIEDLGYQDIMLTPEAVMEEILDIESSAELRLYYDTLPIIARNDKRIRLILKEKEIQLKNALREKALPQKGEESNG
jgi:hypothetical protein